MNLNLLVFYFAAVMVLSSGAYGAHFGDVRFQAEMMRDQVLGSSPNLPFTRQASSECIVFVCLAEGSPCSLFGNITISEDNITTFSLCNFNTYCDPETLVCVPTVEEGEPCTGNGTNPLSGSECGLAANSTDFIEVLHCTNGTCQRFFDFASVGSTCLTSDDCLIDFLNSTALTCTAGICTGLPLGSECNDTLECDFGLYCSPRNSTCQTVGGLGDPCITVNDFGTQDSCGSRFVCGIADNVTSADGSNTSCNPLFEKDIGEACLVTEECLLGLVCHNSTCSDFPTTSCTYDTDCEGGFCGCNIRGEQICVPPEPVLPFAEGCEDTLDELLICAEENRCKTIFWSGDECVAINCPREFACVQDCIREGSFADLIENGCLTLPESECTTLPTGGTTGLPGTSGTSTGVEETSTPTGATSTSTGGGTTGGTVGI